MRALSGNSSPRWLALAWTVLAALAVAPGHAIAQSPPPDGPGAPSHRAWLGVELARGPAGGVVAKHVINNSPAAKAGIADGDQILAAESTPLDDPKQLIAKVALLGPNAPLSLRVRHGGAERNVAAQLIAHPGMEQILRLDKLNTFAPAWKSPLTAAGVVPASLASVRGKVVLVDFWASWCGPCRMIAPQLSRWQSSYGAQGLTVVGFTGDDITVAAQAAQGMSMSYAIASDPHEATAGAYGVSALPTMFLIDKKGVIREIVVGYDPGRHKELEKLIQTLLAEPAPAP